MNMEAIVIENLILRGALPSKTKQAAGVSQSRAGSFVNIAREEKKMNPKKWNEARDSFLEDGFVLSAMGFEAEWLGLMGDLKTGDWACDKKGESH